jgi:hypothetical protein
VSKEIGGDISKIYDKRFNATSFDYCDKNKITAFWASRGY